MFTSQRSGSLATGLALVSLLALTPRPAAAQELDAVDAMPVGSVRGFSLHLDLGVGAFSDDESGFQDESDDVSNGGGLALGLAYGFNETAEVFLELSGYALDIDLGDGVDADESGMGHFDLGGRFYFGQPANKVRPFALLALSGRSIVIEDGDASLTFSGGALTYGAGLRYFFSPAWALNAQLTNAYGEFTDVTSEFEGEEDEENDLHIDATTSRFQIGVVWHVGR